MERARILIVAAAAGVLLMLSLGPALLPSARASAQETVRLADGTTIALKTPPFLVKGKRYAFSWPGGGPTQTFTVKDIRPDGWIQVEVAEENVDLSLVPVGTLPVRWLNAALATSIQEMRPIIY